MNSQVPDRLPRRPRAHTLQLFWRVFVPVLVGGTLLTWLIADLRAAISYGGAALLAASAFALGEAGIRAAGRLAPFAAMIVAVGGYGITVLLFALVYAVADPDVITFPAVAAGLLSAVGVWIFASIRSLTVGVNDRVTNRVMARSQGLLVFGSTMTRDNPQDEPVDESGRLGDPWAAFGYLVAGVGFYGLLGWLLSWWLHAPWLIPVGILFGAGLGLYLVYARLGKIPKPESTTSRASPEPEPPSFTRPEDPPRPSSDDRGDTE